MKLIQRVLLTDNNIMCENIVDERNAFDLVKIHITLVIIQSKYDLPRIHALLLYGIFCNVGRGCVVLREFSNLK